MPGGQYEFVIGPLVFVVMWHAATDGRFQLGGGKIFNSSEPLNRTLFSANAADRVQLLEAEDIDRDC
jgi:hypothetical protein